MVPKESYFVLIAEKKDFIDENAKLQVIHFVEVIQKSFSKVDFYLALTNTMLIKIA